VFKRATGRADVEGVRHQRTMNDSDDIVKEFLVESYENLDRLDREFVTLEKNPGDRDMLASIFRTIHTIKGTSGFLAFNKLGAVAHVGESLLMRLRDGQLALNQEITNALLATVDAIRQMLEKIEASGGEGERDDSELIARLTRLQQAPAAHMTAAITPTSAPVPAQASVPGATTEAAPTPNRDSDPVVPVPNLGDILMEHSGVRPEEIQLAIKKQKDGDPRRMGEILVEQGAAQPADVVNALRVQQAARGQSASDSTIRLDVSLLDQLMNLVGELVLTRNQILQLANSSERSELLAASQRLNLITTELQGGVMKTRMQPIGNIWGKLPRTVRDLAIGCGKRVRVEMEGKEIELDKTLIEAIKDPLTHLVRNSVDHGIESPEARQAAGKDPEGRLCLRAFHEGGQVNIEISDDGAGLNVERIRAKAVQKDLISAEQAARLSDREVVNLVFLPGFSTAETVTNVSGRGVGMDVVRTHIEKIGGTVDLESRPGQGVMVRMKIPLTLAIIPALIVTSDGERYAVPQVNLVELVGLDGESARKGIESVRGQPVYRLRGRLLPLVYLNRVLKNTSKSTSKSTPKDVPQIADTKGTEEAAALETTMAVSPKRGGANIVVLEADGRKFGMVVDEINDTEEIVVKPLSKHLKSVTAYVGATIMGDGKVALILDVLGLAQTAKIGVDGRDRIHDEEALAIVEVVAGKQQLVLFTGGSGAQMAVPLKLLARLENIPGAEVERSGNQWVTQYRGGILPLIRVTHALEERRQLTQSDDMIHLPTQAMLQVLVLETERQSFGLVVKQILDIVESTLETRSPATRTGVLHCSVIGERVTELLDVPALLRAGEAYDPQGRSTEKCRSAVSGR
jgi:two-component system chemotaxis sensor kinase CheA